MENNRCKNVLRFHVRQRTHLNAQCRQFPISLRLQTLSLVSEANLFLQTLSPIGNINIIGSRLILKEVAVKRNQHTIRRMWDRIPLPHRIWRGFQLGFRSGLPPAKLWLSSWLALAKLRLSSSLAPGYLQVISGLGLSKLELCAFVTVHQY